MNIRQIKSLALLNLKGNWGNFIAIYLSLSALTVFLVLDHMLTYQILKLSGITDFYSINFFNYPTLASIMIIKTMAMLCILVMIRFMVKRQFADIKHGKGITNSRNAMYKDLFAFFKISFVPYLIKYLIVLALIIPSILGAFLIRKQIIYSKTNEITLPFLFIFMTVVLLTTLSVVAAVNAFISMKFLPHIFIYNPKTKCFTAIKRSFAFARGNKLKILLFNLSFAKFIPLLIFVYPIFAISPYYLMANIVLIEDIMGERYCSDTFYDVPEDIQNDKDLETSNNLG